MNEKKRDWWVDEEELQKFISESIKKNEEEANRQLAKERQEKLQKILTESGLGKRFFKRKFDNFLVNNNNKEAFEQAKRYVEEFDGSTGLMFVGGAGTGKTHLAAAIVNELVERGYKVMFGNSTDIIARMRKSFKEGESDIDIISKITDVDLLVIDDLGKEKESEYTNMIIYQIINRLYEDEKALIITTNYTSFAVKERLGDYGDAILSRLLEMCKVVKLTGEDWRKKNAKYKLKD